MSTIVLHDNDNTISFTSEADEYALEKAFQDILEYHPELFNFEKDFRGKDIKVICEKITEKTGITLSEDERRKNFRSAFNEATHLIKPTPGCVETVTALHEEGIIQAIATNGPHVRLKTIFDHYRKRNYSQIFINALSEHQFSALDDLPQKQLKPKPDIFLYAYKQVSKNMSDVKKLIMVDDSVTGVTAAVAARKILNESTPAVDVIVLGYVGDRKLIKNADIASAKKELIIAGADHSIVDMIEILKYVQASKIQTIIRSATHAP